MSYGCLLQDGKIRKFSPRVNLNFFRCTAWVAVFGAASGRLLGFEDPAGEVVQGLGRLLEACGRFPRGVLGVATGDEEFDLLRERGVAGPGAGMAEVTAHGGVPIVADESCRSLSDLERLARRKAAHGANLKLVKLGGLQNSLRIGRRAQDLGLALMAGAMVETRLGLTAMAHLVTALGGVEWLDLDTAFLLAADPFHGGYEVNGPELTLINGPGLGVGV